MPERIDRVGEHKTAFRKNKKIILATQDVCALCGAPVDKTLRAPDPMSPNVDHIIPIAKGGHPSSLENLQLTHRWCNLHKGDRLCVPGMKHNCDNKNSSGYGKDPGDKNNPPVVKDRGVKNNPPIKTTTPSVSSADSSAAAFSREEINNNDLPLHADWTTIEW